MNNIIFDTTFYDSKNIESCTMLEHDNEIYSLTFKTKTAGLEHYQCDNNIFIFGEGITHETIELPEVATVEKLADCIWFSKQENKTIKYIWIPLEIFDDIPQEEECLNT